MIKKQKLRFFEFKSGIFDFFQFCRGGILKNFFQFLTERNFVKINLFFTSFFVDFWVKNWANFGPIFGVKNDPKIGAKIDPNFDSKMGQKNG